MFEHPNLPRMNPFIHEPQDIDSVAALEWRVKTCRECEKAASENSGRPLPSRALQRQAIAIAGILRYFVPTTEAQSQSGKESSAWASHGAGGRSGVRSAKPVGIDGRGKPHCFTACAPGLVVENSTMGSGAALRLPRRVETSLLPNWSLVSNPLQLALTYYPLPVRGVCETRR